MSGEPTTEEVTRWALRAGQGDMTAMALFVRATQAEVWRVCSHLGNRWAADDLTQEVFLRAHRSLPRFRGESSARTWLLTIARRVCADHVREEMRRPTLTPLDELNEPAEPADHSAYGALRELLEHIDADRKEAFVMTQLLGLSYAEAAEVCGCPVGTIRSRVARAREDLAVAVRRADQAHEA
ncbi:sigma-70 family RNA polymerase sigma factor [Blastococcus sp. Marseille-P5729]|uniref:sigma-70 family RNA polymerase sigma factor n=1 Tax=Blastococcus sp. Marseille-P5729 TaxID=2086582 RepID=UPI001F2A48E7|nr:sigma-70 family RNA polymerase sigma factor [Blastococcus sp. Marseille-P5729]